MKSAFSAMARDDTMLGACHAISTDLGLNPLWMRIGFALALFWNPAAAAAAYAMAVLLSLAARTIVPEPTDLEAEETAFEEALEPETAYELPLAA
jgi:phage shock protein PspC (stress-responsive transcriptional regulator)